MKPKDSILLIEDSAFFSNAVENTIARQLDVEIVKADSLKEAQSALDSGTHDFAIAIVDLNLPDSVGHEIVQLVSAYQVPSIVFSGTLDAEGREELFRLGVIDSVPKDSPASLNYVVSLAGRLLKNRFLTALVVEDSDVVRGHVARQLERQGLQVVEAPNGEEGLEALRLRKDIRLVLLDYQMPKKDGFEMLRDLRKNHTKEKTAVIGMSAVDNTALAIRFLKLGANDFIHKPFGNEELLCRVSQNLEMLEHIERFEHMATRDFLTGLHNRRYLFEAGNTLYANAIRENLNITVGMLDIDFFKKVNDTYGHDAGDVVLQMTAQTLKEEFREADIIARMGGEEYCVVAFDMNPGDVEDVFNRARTALSEKHIQIEGKSIQVTTSIGVCNTREDGFEKMINLADKALYDAKEGGRNRVAIWGH